MTKLSIVILNWNGKRYLERFMPTLLRYMPDYAELVQTVRRAIGGNPDAPTGLDAYITLNI